MKIFLGVLILGLTAGGAFFGGHLVSTHRLPSHELLLKADRLLGKVDARVKRLIRGDEQAPAEPLFSQQFESIFVRLQGDGARIPANRPGFGGGATSFGDAVVLVTHEGRIFAARSAEDIVETQILTPDSGFDAYVRIAGMEEHKDYNHAEVFERYRFNDILHFKTAAGQGLALSYTEFDAKEVCYRNTVATLAIADEITDISELRANAGDWDILFRAEPCLPLKRQRRAIEPHMAGGRMTFSEPGTIILGSGDYHWDGIRGPEAIAQRPEMDYGKVIAIDLETGAARHLSSGHRNIQGITLDRTGQVWAVEHGPRGGDELNRIVEGADFGWPLETLGTSYDGTPWPLAISYGRHDTFQAPTFAWLPSIATSALTRIENFHDSWNGDLLLATLIDQSLHRIRIKDNAVEFVERIPFGKRIRYVHQHSDGRLVVWTDDRYLIFLTITDTNFFADIIAEYLEGREYTEPQLRQVKAALEDCMQCHAFDTPEIAGAAERNAPSLGRIFNEPIAASTYPFYSPALRAQSGRWTAENLSAFLSDPQAWAPGTSMPGGSHADPFTIEELVGLLEAMTAATE